MLLLVLAGGCETPEAVAPPPAPVPEPEPVVPVVAPAPVAPPSGGMVVRLHAESDALMPEGAVATVTLQRPGARHTAELPKGARLLEFSALEPGRYDLLVAVHSRGVEIGSFGYFVRVGETVGDVTVRVDYLRADLEVEATVETASERRYVGLASVVSDTCPGAATDSAPAPVDLVLATDGDGIELTLANFAQDTTRLSGRRAPPDVQAFAAGTFESSTANSGDWRLLHLSAPARGALAAVVALEDRTRACAWRLEYAGLLEEGHAEAVLGAHVGGPTVEVVGHGEAHAVVLDPGASTARFEGLFVGPYDVYVGLHGGGEGSTDGRREAVVLTAEGARVATTFEREWAPVAASPLGVRDDYGALSGIYHGKSVVVRGRPACTGSIALVDTTELMMAARGRDLALTFDSFYGKVLALTGAVGEDTGAFAATGTYEASDGKTGAWSMQHVSAPTDRALALLVEFDNETDGCAATHEFAGVRAGGRGR